MKGFRFSIIHMGLGRQFIQKKQTAIPSIAGRGHKKHDVTYLNLFPILRHFV